MTRGYPSVVPPEYVITVRLETTSMLRDSSCVHKLTQEMEYLQQKYILIFNLGVPRRQAKVNLET